MNAIWKCGVCEAVNQGGTTCTACGASMTRRSRVLTSARARLTPPVPPPPEPAPLPEPVRRAISREPVPEEELEYEDDRLLMLPMPGGCLVLGRPRSW
jgi:hypothetical protein